MPLSLLRLSFVDLEGFIASHIVLANIIANLVVAGNPTSDPRSSFDLGHHMVAIVVRKMPHLDLTLNLQPSYPARQLYGRMRVRLNLRRGQSVCGHRATPIRVRRASGSFGTVA